MIETMQEGVHFNMNPESFLSNFRGSYQSDKLDTTWVIHANSEEHCFLFFGLVIISFNNRRHFRITILNFLLRL